MNRRNFLKLAGASSLALGWPSAIFAQEEKPTLLQAVKRVIDVNGKAANVFGITRDGNHPGLILDAGSTFDIALENRINEPTLIHWHGLTPPSEFDGVPDHPRPMLVPDEQRLYKFPVGKGGTHWMHAHTLQEQNLLAAPLIVRTAEDRKSDVQEVTIMLHDFSFTPASELLSRLQNAQAGMSDQGMNSNDQMQGMNHSMGGGMQMGKSNMSSKDMMAMMGGMDLNDIEFDAYLANDRTLSDPEVVKVEKSGRVRLRIINGATATAFTIDTGELKSEVIAVDGQSVKPLSLNQYPISMGQRIDIAITLPKDGGAFPILALREGAKQRTGIILATKGAGITKISQEGNSVGPTIGTEMEISLTSSEPLTQKKSDKRFEIMLTGNMMNGYRWAMNPIPDLVVNKGDRVEVFMHNMSMMTHPMHLHGHHFQVVNVNGRRINGAVRDTVAIPPMVAVTIAFDADNVGEWAFHCHHLYHMATGMMQFLKYA